MIFSVLDRKKSFIIFAIYSEKLTDLIKLHREWDSQECLKLKNTIKCYLITSFLPVLIDSLVLKYVSFTYFKEMSWFDVDVFIPISFSAEMSLFVD